MNFGLAPLIGKCVAIISDARLGGRADQHAIAERLLSITGEDAITIDRKYLSAWTGQLQARFIIISNELPRLADASGALASRFIVLVLINSFYGREDQSLIGRLLTELPGILNWAIVRWRRLTERGHFLQPRSALDAVRQLEDLGSPIGAFLRERCVIGAGCRSGMLSAEAPRRFPIPDCEDVHGSAFSQVRRCRLPSNGLLRMPLPAPIASRQSPACRRHNGKCIPCGR
jgi:putative DNA primase/helicase